MARRSSKKKQSSKFPSNRSQMSKALSNLRVNTDNDKDFLANHNFDWSDLMKFQSEMNSYILEFVVQANRIAANKELIAKLGDQKADFQRYMTTFYSDVDAFTRRTEALYKRVPKTSGKIETMDEYGLYNQIGIEHHTLMSDLTSIVAPTLTQVVMILSSIDLVVDKDGNKVEETKPNLEEVVPERVDLEQPVEENKE